MKAFYEESILSVRHVTDTLFGFTTTRSPGCRFKNGQFVMIGLEVEGRPLLRAYPHHWLRLVRQHTGATWRILRQHLVVRHQPENE